jgi:hypothetical protein
MKFEEYAAYLAHKWMDSPDHHEDCMCGLCHTSCKWDPCVNCVANGGDSVT